MIICVCKQFEVMGKDRRGTGKFELLVDYAVDIETGINVIVPNTHPAALGAKWDSEIGEWVL